MNEHTQPAVTQNPLIWIVSELLETEFPPPTYYIHPLLLKNSINMIYSWRGVGKTWFTLSLALAIASRKEFLGLRVENPARVLLIDGEMGRDSLKNRIATLLSLLKIEKSELNSFAIIPPNGFDLCKSHQQKEMEKYISNYDVIIFDNISSLFPSASRENDAESVSTINPWFLSLKAQGKTVIAIHHSGKSGEQRGTSRREDIMDTVLKLESIESKDIAFKISFEKNRHLDKSSSVSFIATLDPEKGWLRENARRDSETKETVLKLKSDGASIREIAEVTGVSKSSVQRIVSNDYVPGGYD